MPTEILMSRLQQFQIAKERLAEARQSEFHQGRAVHISNKRYHGYGMIVSDDSCPVDQLAVKLENGNKWWYPLEDCTLAHRKECPPWLQRLIRYETRSALVVKQLKARETEINK